MIIVAGTGHRPDKVGGYTSEVAFKLYNTAFDWVEAHKETIGHIISGGALGWDQALAGVAREQEIPYTMALPFPGFEDRWPMASKHYLHGLMATADKVVYVKDAPYAGWKMQARNEYMVDNSDLILALWNGTEGGTANCIHYAEKKRKLIVNLWGTYE